MAARPDPEAPTNTSGFIGILSAATCPGSGRLSLPSVWRSGETRFRGSSGEWGCWNRSH